MDAIFNQWTVEGPVQKVPVTDPVGKIENLIWLPDHGMGYFPVKERDWPYNQDYFNKYTDYANTVLGQRITQCRIDFVNRYYDGPILDIGIGCGDFVNKYGNGRFGMARGYDVNPAAVDWLKEQGKYQNPLRAPMSRALTFWDSLEHIEAPGVMVLRSIEWVFICTPIYRDLEHVMTSKHFRSDEHYWYWTHKGLVTWMDAYGFDWQGFHMAESFLGREDIETFSFKRR